MTTYAVQRWDEKNKKFWHVNFRTNKKKALLDLKKYWLENEEPVRCIKFYTKELIRHYGYSVDGNPIPSAPTYSKNDVRNLLNDLEDRVTCEVWNEICYDPHIDEDDIMDKIVSKFKEVKDEYGCR